MVPEKYELSWKEFQQCASQSFKDHYNSEEYSDVTLACDDDKQIKTHKMVLSASSPFFQKILRNNPHQHPLIYLKGVNYDSLRSLLMFMYLGETKVTEDELKPFLDAADELKIKGLSENNSSSNRVRHIKKEPAQIVTDQNQLSNIDYGQYNYMDTGAGGVSTAIATTDMMYDVAGYDTGNIVDTNYSDPAAYNSANFFNEFHTLTDMDIKSVLTSTKYPCDHCVYKAASKELLVAHMTNLHAGDISVTLKSDKRKQNQGLVQKMKKITVRCNLCEMVLLNEESALLEHVKSMHGA